MIQKNTVKSIKHKNMTNLEYNQLSERKQILQTRIFSLKDTYHLDPMAQEAITAVIEESRREIAKIEEALTTKREYLYNFIGGGWNSEYAHTQELAIKQANERWSDGNHQPDLNSFRVSTPADYQNLLSLFY
jgi:hypothetical protein